LIDDDVRHCPGIVFPYRHAADLMLLLAGDPAVAYVQGTVDVEVADFADNRVDVDPIIHSAFVQLANGVRGYFLNTIGYDWELSGATGVRRALSDGRGLELRRQTRNWKTPRRRRLAAVTAREQRARLSGRPGRGDRVRPRDAWPDPARAPEPGADPGHHRLARPERRASRSR
jgi:hypothetical protein